jgi:hypothetical protein
MVYKNRLQILNALNEVRDLRRKIKEKLPDASGSAITNLNACDTLVVALTTSTDPKQNFKGLDGLLNTIFNVLQESDMPPTSQAITAAKDTDMAFKVLWQRWMEVKKKIQSCLGEMRKD